MNAVFRRIQTRARCRPKQQSRITIVAIIMHVRVLCNSLFAASISLAMYGQATSVAGTPAPQPVPVIDGAAGPCSLELTIKDNDGKPAAAAAVKVHIAYRFGGFHKLDLEAGTNVDGKVKFTGLPSRVRRPPLEFHASKAELAGTIQFDPATTCHDKQEVRLSKPEATPDRP